MLTSCAAVLSLAAAASAQTTNQTPSQPNALTSRAPAPENVTITGCVAGGDSSTAAAADGRFVLTDATLSPSNDAHGGVNTGATSSDGGAIQSASGTGSTDRIGPTAGITGSRAGSAVSGTTSAGTTGGTATTPARGASGEGESSGVAAASVNSGPHSYALAGSRAGELSSYVGRRVEVIGTLDAAGPSAAVAGRAGDSSRDGDRTRAATGADARSNERPASSANDSATSTDTNAQATDAAGSRGDARATTGTRSGSPGAVTSPGSKATSVEASRELTVESFRAVTGDCR
jgi:hypothetical protein